MPEIIATDTRLGTSTRTVTATFTGYTPIEGDDVLIFAGIPTDGSAPAVTPPSGWATVAQVGHTLGSLSAVHHVVTSGEATGGTTTFTATNHFNLAKSWRSVACVVRDVNQADLIDGFGTANGASTTPHPTAAIAGGGLSSGSLVLACVSAGDNRTYSGAPAGWSLAVSNSSGTGIGLWVRASASSAGEDVTSVNVTPSAAAAYTAISVAVSALPTDSGQFFAFF